MPTLLKWRGWIFGFYDGDLGEPPHIQARKGGDAAIARSRGCTARELADILAKVREHREEFLEKWNGYFGN